MLAESRGLNSVFASANGDPDVPVLELKDLSVAFGGIIALSQIHCRIDRHELVAIIGPNGAGKSTMLNAIGGLVKSTGEIELFGRSVRGVPPAKIAVAGLGRSFQDPQIIDDYTVLENVLCGAHITLDYGLMSQLFRFRMVRRLETDMARRARTLLEFMGLDAVADHEAGSLPYGARKLVDIARAMVPGPQLLLLDEPSSGLDAHERKNLETTLIALREERLVTLLVVEHHMDLVRAVSTRVVGIQAGEVLMTGAPADVLDSELFREAIVGGSHHDEGFVDDEATAISEENQWSA